MNDCDVMMAVRCVRRGGFSARQNWGGSPPLGLFVGGGRAV